MGAPPQKKKQILDKQKAFNLEHLFLNSGILLTHLHILMYFEIEDANN